ncbi:MAG TPA: hypothetical protein VH558_15060 [Pseudolabrys sp.]|jgi:hypothetical protein
MQAISMITEVVDRQNETTDKWPIMISLNVKKPMTARQSCCSFTCAAAHRVRDLFKDLPPPVGARPDLKTL